MMNNDESIKKLPITEVLKSSADYFGNNWKMMLLFTLVNYLTMVLGLYSWRTGWLWPVLVLIYLFWSFFFRYYFNRQPYLYLKPIVSSMVPSTKIVVLSVVITSILVVLPFAPLFMGFSSDFNERYTHFLQQYMQDSDLVDLGLNVILVAISPWIFYRPFLAWVSALIGRSGSLRSAWLRTRGNYWEFLLIALMFNFAMVLLQKMFVLAGALPAVILLAMSPLVIYFNIVMAKSYEVFYIDIE